MSLRPVLEVGWWGQAESLSMAGEKRDRHILLEKAAKGPHTGHKNFWDFEFHSGAVSQWEIPKALKVGLRRLFSETTSKNLEKMKWPSSHSYLWTRWLFSGDLIPYGESVYSVSEAEADILGDEALRSFQPCRI